MHTRLLVAVTLSLSCEGKDDTATAGDADADADADSDSDTDTFFMNAKGTLNGKPFTLDCPPDYLEAGRKGALVGAGCADLDGGPLLVEVLATDPVVGDITECSKESWIRVAIPHDMTNVYHCLLGGLTAYDMNITEVEETPLATVWAGTFSMTGDDGTHSADVSGAFRVKSTEGK